MNTDTATEKLPVLREVKFGSRIAEEEAEDLAAYFVETEQWRRVWSGDVDVVYGPKGSGKSAIYSTLIARENDLFDRAIFLAAAVNPRGSAAFEGIAEAPPTSESEFVGLWKVYLLLLIADTLEEYSIVSKQTETLIGILSEARLRPHGKKTLKATLALAMNYVRRLTRPSEVEPKVEIGPTIAFSTKIRFEEPTADERKSGAVQVDELFEMADDALSDAEYSLWVLLDRLDVAFEGSPELEVNALRALFRVYLDLSPYRNIKLKIFLRTDIWHAITSGGFREASHITRDLTLEWDRPALLRLVIQRLVQSNELCNYYDIFAKQALDNIKSQEAFLGEVYPPQVESGPKKSRTFDWCLRRTQDGTGRTAPRELIHLLTAAKDRQIRLLELGSAPPAGTTLFSPQALKEALPEVSDARLTRTMYAEFAELKEFMEALRGLKTNHNAVSLSIAWDVSESIAREHADRLVEVGFFERRKNESGEILYWVPFLYRPALEMIQGSAEGVTVAVRDDDDDHEEADQRA